MSSNLGYVIVRAMRIEHAIITILLTAYSVLLKWEFYQDEGEENL